MQHTVHARTSDDPSVSKRRTRLMTVKKSQQVITALVAICLLTGLVSPAVIAREVSADSIHQVSSQFMGTIKDDGILVPAGYKIIAKVDGVEKASTTTTSEGKYGFDSPFVITAYEGKTVEFWINGVLADQTGIIQEGQLTFLNLTCNTGNPPVPSSTPETISTPSLPYTPTYLRGTVTQDGALVPAGYNVVAKVRGVQLASTTTSSEGKFGFDAPFGVAAQDGDTIVFYINGMRAEQTVTAEGGSMSQVDLSYVSAGTTSPAPATTGDTSPSGTTPAAASTSPAANNPEPSPKPASSPDPQSPDSGSMAQPVAIGFVAVMSVLCLLMVYIIMKRRQPPAYAGSFPRSEPDTPTWEREPRIPIQKREPEFTARPYNSESPGDIVERKNLPPAGKT